MFDLELQRRIREKKTPLALTLAPEAEKLNGKFVKNFIDMFGDTPMAQAEALRYHGTTLLDAAAGKLPAVVLRGGDCVAKSYEDFWRDYAMLGGKTEELMES